MNVINKIKTLSEKVPPNVGVILNKISFEFRLGPKYKKYYNNIQFLLGSDTNTKRQYIEKSFEYLINHFSKNGFYQSIINSNISYDFSSIQPVTKTILKDIPIDSRTIKEYALAKYNTGGTSGSPLSFYVEKGFYAKEWAHMHYMWKKIGYHPSNTKITIRGKNIDGLYRYNFNQNEFLINSYKDLQKDDYDRLLRIFKKYNTQFIHGYPSAIFNFLKKVEKESPILLEFLKNNIKGIMFGSEYPSPHYRNYIEEILTHNTISWYGHTEGVILAGELYSKYEYVPFLSYGFAEAVMIDGYYHLVGTSFHNLAAPFIRYDTEDLIEPYFSESGLLEKFKIKEGRIGEFIIDKNGNSISLTAMIFGRHHKLFDYIDFIQVKQIAKGEVIIYYSAKNVIPDPNSIFDSNQLNLNISFEQINEPYKTPIGKIPLLIK